MDMIIPPLRLKIMLESNPLKSTMLVRRLAVCAVSPCRLGVMPSVLAPTRVAVRVRTPNLPTKINYTC